MTRLRAIQLEIDREGFAGGEGDIHIREDDVVPYMHFVPCGVVFPFQVHAGGEFWGVAYAFAEAQVQLYADAILTRFDIGEYKPSIRFRTDLVLKIITVMTV